jgi:hypothetical protein
MLCCRLRVLLVEFGRGFDAMHRGIESTRLPGELCRKFYHVLLKYFFFKKRNLPIAKKKGTISMFILQRESSRGMLASLADPTSANIYLSNLPFHWGEEELRALFGDTSIASVCLIFFFSVG